MKKPATIIALAFAASVLFGAAGAAVAGERGSISIPATKSGAHYTVHQGQTIFLEGAATAVDVASTAPLGVVHAIAGGTALVADKVGDATVTVVVHPAAGVVRAAEHTIIHITVLPLLLP